MRRSAPFLIATGLLAACTIEPPEPDAAALYDAKCAVCHGATGQGDGALAADLNPAPADLTALGAGGDFPLMRVLNQIDGYAREGHQTMPAFGAELGGVTESVDLGDGVLTPVPAELLALARYIEGLAG